MSEVESNPTCIIVVLPDGRLEPFWSAEGWFVDDQGKVTLTDESATLASFAAGEWQAVGEMRLAEDVILTDRNGKPVRHRPEIWEE